VVDDESASRLLIRRALSPIEVNITECKSAEEAVELITQVSFAVAIVDVHLPIMDGFELADRVRSASKNTQTPIIFLTGKLVDKKHIQRAYALGAIDFLEKSTTPPLLCAKVSVFVDLDRRHRDLLLKERENYRLEQEREQLQDHVKRLESTISSFRRLSSAGSKTSVTGSISGIGPVRDRAPDEFARLVTEYVAIMDQFLESLVTDAPKPVEHMHKVVYQLTTHVAGPRDLLDVHVDALEQAVAGVNPHRADAYSIEGRLLALEMMGLMLDNYRLGINNLTEYMRTE
jgi:response regulator RpfG family c-di-GMP phosphodiesterase